MLDKFIEFCKHYEQHHIDNVAKVYMVIATLFHCLSQAVFKYAHIPIFQALFDRSFLSIFLLHQMYPKDDYYPPNKLGNLIISQILMAVGTGFVYQSLNYIPMAETVVIFQTNTIWSQFLIHLINKETITKNRLINTVVCFIGIILIVNPKFDNANSITHTIGCLLAFITSITQVFCYIYVKKVGATIKPTMFTFYFHFCMLIMCSIGQFYHPHFEFKISTILYICSMTLLSLVGHLLQYRSLSLVIYSKIAIYTYTSILFTMIIDFLVFNKVTHLIGFIGGAMILCCLIKQVYEDKAELEKKKCINQMIINYNLSVIFNNFYSKGKPFDLQILLMGNCETGNTVITDPQFLTQQIGQPARPFSSTYKSEYVEVHQNLAVVEEQEEGGLVLLEEPAKDIDTLKVKICCDTVQTSVGIGIVDFEKVKEPDFSGQCTYGLDHGMWIVYSDKQVAASNNPDLDKKSLGIEVKQGDIIECTKNGNQFSIKKAGDNQQITFTLENNKQYRFAAYLFSGWDSQEGKVSEARIETL